MVHKPIEWRAPNSPMKKALDDLFFHFEKGWKERGLSPADVAVGLDKLHGEMVRDYHERQSKLPFRPLML